MVKSEGVQRESDGVAVPGIGVQHDAPGGKGPDFGHVARAGKCEGMTGSPVDYPGRPQPVVAVAGGPSAAKVRELRRRLWRVAKQQEGRRFHALYDRVHRGDVLWEAWGRPNRAGTRIEWIIDGLNPILRGWGNHFRTGNAADKFRQIDSYVEWRLKRLLLKKRGRNLHAGVAQQWTEDWFNQRGLYRLRGTVRYPKAA